MHHRKYPTRKCTTENAPQKMHLQKMYHRKCTTENILPENVHQKMYHRKCTSRKFPTENVPQKMYTRKCPSLFASTRKIISKCLFTHPAQAARHKSLSLYSRKNISQQVQGYNHAEMRISGHSIMNLAIDSWNALHRHQAELCVMIIAATWAWCKVSKAIANIS